MGMLSRGSSDTSSTASSASSASSASQSTGVVGDGGGATPCGCSSDSSGTSMMNRAALSSSVAQQLTNVMSNLHPGHALLTASVPLLLGAYRSYHRPLDTIVDRVMKKQQEVGSAASAGGGGGQTTAVAAATSPSSATTTTTTAKPTMTERLSNKATARVTDLLLAGSGNNSKLAQSQPPQPTIQQETALFVRRAIGSAVAGRALYVATLGSCGVFCFAGAMTFYLSGTATIDQAMTQTRKWATSTRHAIDSRYFDTEQRREQRRRLEQDDPDAIAIRHMTEQEEMDYIATKYFPPSVTGGATENEAGDEKQTNVDRQTK